MTRFFADGGFIDRVKDPSNSRTAYTDTGVSVVGAGFAEAIDSDAGITFTTPAGTNPNDEVFIVTVWENGTATRPTVPTGFTQVFGDNGSFGGSTTTVIGYRGNNDSSEVFIDDPGNALGGCCGVICSVRGLNLGSPSGNTLQESRENLGAGSNGDSFVEDLTLEVGQYYLQLSAIDGGTNNNINATTKTDQWTFEFLAGNGAAGVTPDVAVANVERGGQVLFAPGNGIENDTYSSYGHNGATPQVYRVIISGPALGNQNSGIYDIDAIAYAGLTPPAGAD